jgi:hypothetical protein
MHVSLLGWSREGDAASTAPPPKKAGTMLSTVNNQALQNPVDLQSDFNP